MNLASTKQGSATTEDCKDPHEVFQERSWAVKSDKKQIELLSE